MDGTSYWSEWVAMLDHRKFHTESSKFCEFKFCVSQYRNLKSNFFSHVMWFYSPCNRNLKTGQMLQQILLCDGSSNLACVRAYTSYVSLSYPAAGVSVTLPHPWAHTSISLSFPASASSPPSLYSSLSLSLFLHLSFSTCYSILSHLLSFPPTLFPSLCFSPYRHFSLLSSIFLSLSSPACLDHPVSLTRSVFLSLSVQGVLLVLLQHQLLGALEEVGEEQDVGVTVRRTSWLSLLAVNPLNGRSVLAGHLYPPETWSGRWDHQGAPGIWITRFIWLHFSESLG